MKAKLDYDAIRSAAQAEAFCDVGHFHCPYLDEHENLIFPSGTVAPDGSFDGARRLFELLAAAPAESVNLFVGGGYELAGRYHYPSGTECRISTLPERPALSEFAN